MLQRLYTFYVDVPLSLGFIIRKVSAEDIAIRGHGTGLEYMCPTRHFVYIFFNPVFQLSTAKNEINLFNNLVLIVAPVAFAPAGATTPSAEFLFCLRSVGFSVSLTGPPFIAYKMLKRHEKMHAGNAKFCFGLNEMAFWLVGRKITC